MGRVRTIKTVINIREAGGYLTFTTAGKIRKTAGHIEPQTLCLYVHTPKQPAKSQ